MIRGPVSLADGFYVADVVDHGIFHAGVETGLHARPAAGRGASQDHREQQRDEDGRTRGGRESRVAEHHGADDHQIAQEAKRRNQQRGGRDEAHQNGADAPALRARKQHGGGWTVQPEDLVFIDETLASLGIRDIAFRQLGELSGGQRQLASVAQTLVREPEVLLMDEPTSALDLHRQLQVLAFTRELARRRGLLVFIAIHDLNQALRFSDKTLVLANGRLCASGPSSSVISAEMLHEVYQVNARVERCSHGTLQVIVDAVAPSRDAS